MGHTRYPCAPLGHEIHVGVVFIALLHDIVAQAIERHSRLGAPFGTRLLVVLASRAEITMDEPDSVMADNTLSK